MTQTQKRIADILRYIDNTVNLMDDPANLLAVEKMLDEVGSKADNLLANEPIDY